MIKYITVKYTHEIIRFLLHINNAYDRYTILSRINRQGKSTKRETWRF